jgi:hypothetical protein
MQSSLRGLKGGEVPLMVMMMMVMMMMMTMWRGTWEISAGHFQCLNLFWGALGRLL